MNESKGKEERHFYAEKKRKNGNTNVIRSEKIPHVPKLKKQQQRKQKKTP